MHKEKAGSYNRISSVVIVGFSLHIPGFLFLSKMEETFLFFFLIRFRFIR